MELFPSTYILSVYVYTVLSERWCSRNLCSQKLYFQLSDSGAPGHTTDATNYDTNLDYSDDEARVEISDCNEDDERVPASRGIKQNHKPNKVPAGKERASKARSASNNKGPKKKGIKAPAQKSLNVASNP